MPGAPLHETVSVANVDAGVGPGLRRDDVERRPAAST
jgi:hypothetical protein